MIVVFRSNLLPSVIYYFMGQSEVVLFTHKFFYFTALRILTHHCHTLYLKSLLPHRFSHSTISLISRPPDCTWAVLHTSSAHGRLPPTRPFCCPIPDDVWSPTNWIFLTASSRSILRQSEAVQSRVQDAAPSISMLATSEYSRSSAAL